MDDLGALVRRAQKAMDEYRARPHPDRDTPSVSVDGLPQVLVPARVIGADLLRILDPLVGAASASTVSYRLGEQIGSELAAGFLDGRDGDADDVRFRLVAGLLHVRWSGYASPVLLHWEPQRDERLAMLWEAEDSFCATEALADGRRSRACQLLAGYSAGWCARATDLPVRATEVSCRAEGVARCRMLVAHADGLEDRLRDARFYRPTADYATVGDQRD
jgi:hypothetical protein